MLQQYFEAKHRLFEGKSNSQVHLRPNISWNTPFQLLFSTNTTSLFTGLSKYRGESSDLSEAPSNSLTLGTLPLLSLYTFTIRAIGHWFGSASCLSNTMSPTWQFRFWLFHISLFWRFSRTSFLHLSQNLLAICCTLLHCFFEYLSGAVKLPGSGITTLDFIVRRLMGLNEAKLVPSFITSAVSGLELIMLQLQQPEFAMILQSSYFHGSSAINSGLNKHFLFGTPKLLPYYLHVMDFAFAHHSITTIFFQKIGNFLVIHFLKGT